MSIITIVGAGMMGTAMTFPAADNGHEVRLVGIRNRENIESVKTTGYHPTLKRQVPKGVKAYHIEDLDVAMEGADLIINGVSSFGVPWFEENVVPRLREDVPVLSVTKGLEMRPDGTLVSFPAALTERAGKKLCINAVGGPVISFELADHIPTEICFCGPDMEILKKLKEMLETEYYHISLTEDVPGLECAVAMKNCYALGVSLAIGMDEKDGDKAHYNPQAALFQQSTHEVMKLMKLMKGNQDNVIFFAGDLYVTVFGGRTRRIGTLLGKGYSYEEAREILTGVTLESVAIATCAANAVRTMEKHGVASTADFPLLMHIDELINQGKGVNIPWNAFEHVIPAEK